MFLATYDTVASVQVMLNSAPVRVFGVRGVPDAIRTADLPARILLPYRAPEAGETFAHAGLVGSMGTVEYAILDLFLLRPVARGEGVHTALPALLQYMENYIRAFYRLRALTSTAVLESMNLDPQVVEYPRGSGAMYHGVVCTLHIRDEIR